ncbi:MAG: Asp-tRNA(Asn)/Glu-tRNA(Gln) amidotransferase subunit GatA, partial [Candidatus Paceibacterota bacterium]
MINLKELTIKKARKHLDDGDFTAVDLAKAYLKEIEAKNKELNVYLEVFSDVLEQATEADRQLQNFKTSKLETPALLGIPLAIKDNILIKGRKAGSASKILEGYVATYDATAIKKLKEAGAIFLGRVNMDEFAMGGSTENSAYGPTRNPHDSGRVAGGSSGGSAAAVAANLALGALGSDTGGSVRQPASFCGVVGLKPTYGSVSRSGLMAMASSLDVIGPVAKTAEDAEIIFNVIKGKDPLDSTSSNFSTSQLPNFSTSKLTIGIPEEILKIEGLSQSVREVLDSAKAKFESLGFKIKPVSLPKIKYSLSAYYIIVPAEVSSNMARFDGVKYGAKVPGADLLEDYLKTRGELLGPEVRRRIIIGTYVLSSGYYDAYYHKANVVRGFIADDFANAFKDVDLILMPTAPSPAFKIGEKAANPLELYLEDVFTVPANLVGLPAISIPAGFAEADGKKLPVGIQLIAPKGGEGVI